MFFLDEILNSYQDLRRVLSRELHLVDAEDVTQETFERAIVYAQSQDISSPRGLLFSIAHGVKIDLLRKKSKITYEKIVENEDYENLYRHHATELNPERELESRQLLEKVCAVLDGLPPRHREAFILCRIHGLSYKETASRMDISHTMVHKYLVQAMRACREAI